MLFSTEETITKENASFAKIKQIGTAAELCPHTGRTCHEHVRIFIAVMPKVPENEIPTVNDPLRKQERYIKEANRIDDLYDKMRENAGINDYDSLWTTEIISDKAIQSIFDRIKDWQEAFEAGNNATPEREARHFTDLQRL